MVENDLSKVFDQEASVAADQLQSVEIIDTTTGSKIRLDKLQAFSRVGNQYVEGIKDIPKGRLWTPRRRTIQSLITLSTPLSCVRIVRSSYFDLEKGEYIFEGVEKSTAEHLNMPPGGIARLEYQIEVGVFHLIKGTLPQELRGNSISSEDADRDLDKFLLP